MKNWRKAISRAATQSTGGPVRELGLVNGDIVLAKPSVKGIFEGLFVESHCCNKCRKIIVSFD